MNVPHGKMKFAVFLMADSNYHIAGWRHPDAVPTVDMDFNEYVKLARTAEHACFDMIFFQDTVAVAGSRAMARGQRNLAQLNRIVKLEPTALISALAAVTMTQVGGAESAARFPFAIRARVMTPIVFWASFVPWARARSPPDTTCPSR